VKKLGPLNWPARPVPVVTVPAEIPVLSEVGA
jgi:hypothetical protein